MAERLLRVRTRQKSKKPEFNFHDSHKKKKLGTSWRKPRGLHNKLRQHIAAKGRVVQPGFGSPKAVRGYHPSGMAEIRVNNVAELAAAQGCAVRIASAVGMKKRLDIQAKAAEMGLKVLNPKGGA
ncbi:MAG: 50S ribosomal protein L32e [Methanothrix sp.]|uniref:50S ribosomal protein L32e n=1 Tax=Methanothrix sp. TaxID=90426 RepID=UPI003BB7D43A